ncbi:hypothetical protein ACFL40_05590, partial [candidate division KSB1 bacterium]
GADMIRKSHHAELADDPFYVWSGACEGRWALTLHKENSFVDLSTGASIRWNTKQSGGRVLRIILGLENGSWLVSEQGSEGTAGLKDPNVYSNINWAVVTLSLDTLQWRNLDINEVKEGGLLSSVNLNRVKYIGCTDLMPGGESEACSRLDWIEVYGK